jgi:hypothetical protein
VIGGGDGGETLGGAQLLEAGEVGGLSDLGFDRRDADEFIEFGEDLIEVFTNGVRTGAGAVFFADLIDLAEEILDKAILFRGEGFVHVREGFAHLADERFPEIQMKRREFEFEHDADDLEEGAVEARLHVFGDGIVEPADFLLGLVEVLGDGVTEMEAGALVWPRLRDWSRSLCWNGKAP